MELRGLGESRLQKIVMWLCGLVARSTSNRFGCTFHNTRRTTEPRINWIHNREIMNSHDVDPEASSAPKEFLDGYVDFSEFIASDGQLSIFRQFRSLAARNLLYLEAELQLLQFEIQAIDDADQALLNNANDKERKTKTEEAIRAWECFKLQTETDPRQAQKLEMIMKLRVLMKEYGMLSLTHVFCSFYPFL